MELKLNAGSVLLVDDNLFEIIGTKSICYDKSNGYYIIKNGTKKVYLHRLLIGAEPGQIVDHINRNKNDNRIVNLRIVSRSLNSYNKILPNHEMRGISFDKCGNRYRACLGHNGKTIKIGSYKTVDLAKEAYNKKAIEIYGNDAFIHQK